MLYIISQGLDASLNVVSSMSSKVLKIGSGRNDDDETHSYMTPTNAMVDTTSQLSDPNISGSKSATGKKPTVVIPKPVAIVSKQVAANVSPGTSAPGAPGDELSLM